MQLESILMHPPDICSCLLPASFPCPKSHPPGSCLRSRPFWTVREHATVGLDLWDQPQHAFPTRSHLPLGSLLPPTIPPVRLPFPFSSLFSSLLGRAKTSRPRNTHHNRFPPLPLALCIESGLPQPWEIVPTLRHHFQASTHSHLLLALPPSLLPIPRLICPPPCLLREDWLLRYHPRPFFPRIRGGSICGEPFPPINVHLLVCSSLPPSHCLSTTTYIS